MSLPILPNESPEESANEFQQEKNSLRRFLVGITATTFGVLVALHPSEFVSRTSRWLYVISVVANALSLIFLIASLFGRYSMLREKIANQDKQVTAVMQGKKYKPSQHKFAMIFKRLALSGLVFYLLAIIASSIFIFIEVLH